MQNNKILVIGATGFIGSHLTAFLLANNLTVTCAVRDTRAAALKFKNAKIIYCDFNNDITKEAWVENLKGVDIVVNAAGVLDGTPDNNIDKVHFQGPSILLEAALEAKVKRIIHISALGIENEDITSYSQTKKLFDNHLMSHSDLDWVILRPSLIYGTNCYGGTSLLRANASLPFIIPLIGEGNQHFQPIHMDDLNKIILFCAEYQGNIRKLYHVVGPEVLSTKEILQGFRRQLGLGKASFIKIPEKLVYLTATVASKIGSGPLSQTSLRLMQNPEKGVFQNIVDFTSIVPRTFQQGIDTTPLTVQSLWHARLFILNPLLIWGIALFWVLSGAVSLLIPSSTIPILMNGSLFSSSVNVGLFYSFAVVDIILGLLFLTKSYKKLSNILQIILICFYTVSLTIIKPVLWIDPFGVLLKNIPLCLIVLVTLAIEDRR